MKRQAQAFKKMKEITVTNTLPVFDGHNDTLLYASSVNYQDARGKWQPIDDTLTVRFTWGLGFREPSLEELYSAPISDIQPSPVYVAAGQTHPKVLHREGERYRDALRRLAAEGGVSDRVVFEDRYLVWSSAASPTCHPRAQ